MVNSYLMERCALKPADPSNTDPIGLVVSSQCNYFASLSFPQVVDLGLRVSKLGNSSVTYEVGFVSRTGIAPRGGLVLITY